MTFVRYIKLSAKGDTIGHSHTSENTCRNQTLGYELWGWTEAKWRGRCKYSLFFLCVRVWWWWGWGFRYVIWSIYFCVLLATFSKKSLLGLSCSPGIQISLSSSRTWLIYEGCSKPLYSHAWGQLIIKQEMTKLS